MKLDIRAEIISSYEKLISDCQEAINNNIDVEKNMRLIKEYTKILNEVKKKPASAYYGVVREMERVSKLNVKKFMISQLRFQESMV